MARSIAAHQAKLKPPAHWPEALHPVALDRFDYPTPFLAVDLDTVRDRYTSLRAGLPEAQCFYAVKCNPSHEILCTLANLGSGFEIASIGELEMLKLAGVDPHQVLYSNPVKPSSHIAAAYEAGLWRFAFDSESELHKLSAHAPGSAVIVRIRVDDSTSIFPLSRKFGAEIHEARALLRLAQALGLRAHGITFHVGSQCTSTAAWRQAIAAVGRLMAQLEGDGVVLEMVDVGGGFPARYSDLVPSVNEITQTLSLALKELLPYMPDTVATEPGRYLVAESGVLVSSVLGREVRAGENWAYLDVGAYNGLMETRQTVNQWRYPLWTSRPDHAMVPHIPFTVTGPSCDSTDTMFHGALLPATLDIDDRVYIGSAGAYTLSYASPFNGFPTPRAIFVGGAS